MLDAGGVDGIEACGWFVVEDDLRPECDGARKTDAFAHSAREIRRPHRLDAGQIDGGECPRYALGNIIATHRAEVVLLEAIRDVLADRQRIEEGTTLKQHRNASP